MRNTDTANTSKASFLPLIFVLLVIIAGVGTGYLLSNTINAGSSGVTLPGTASKSQEGIVDKKTFKDQAEGILREGGIEGEGSFHLERPGGPSQRVALTSTAVDLSNYTNKKVRVWGETFNSEKAGWLMDVGLVETL